jgi:DNA mismatch endonuclease (patch repair protein)
MVREFETPTKEVSERMRRVRSRGTGLEARMEGILRSVGIHYETQPELPGHPDFRLEGTRILVFCDSSFWHGRRKADISGQSFRKNKRLWTSKIAATKVRDARISRSLRRAGWFVLRFWDTDIVRRPEAVEERLRRSLSDEEV